MPAYEYLVVTYELRKHCELRVRDHTILGRTRAEAVDQLSDSLRPLVLDFVDESRREWNSYESKTAAWDEQARLLRAGFSVERFEERGGRNQSTFELERVIHVDGTQRSFAAGKADAYIEDEVAAKCGPKPIEPDQPRILEFDEGFRFLVGTAEERTVELWCGNIEPPDPGFAPAPVAGELKARLVAELNRLGAEGWQVVDVSEDRAIDASAAGTATIVVAARYTLMRERGG